MINEPHPRKGGSHRAPTPPDRRPAPGAAAVQNSHRTGFGSPKGVVPAGPGVIYQDIDPAGSGAVYRKTTASGTTGWEELGAGGTSTSAYCVLGFSDGFYDMPGSPVASYGQAFPFDTTVVNEGGFTVDYTYDVGAGIAVPSDGWYRAGLIGRATWTFDPTAGSAALGAWTTENDLHLFEIVTSASPSGIVAAQQLGWSRISDGTDWHSLTVDGAVFLDIVSGPVQMSAGDFFEATIDVTSDTITSMEMDGEGSARAFRFWVEAL